MITAAAALDLANRLVQADSNLTQRDVLWRALAQTAQPGETVPESWLFTGAFIDEPRDRGVPPDSGRDLFAD